MAKSSKTTEILDELFEETCNKYSFVVCLAQRKFEVGGYEFVGMNWVVDYPFRLKDRCRIKSDLQLFGEIPAKAFAPWSYT